MKQYVRRILRKLRIRLREKVNTFKCVFQDQDFPRLIQADDFPVKTLINLVDVGFRGDLCSEWIAFAKAINCIGFELDEKECKLLNELIQDSGRQGIVYPYAVGGKNSDSETLYITQFPYSSGLRASNKIFMDRIYSIMTENCKVMCTKTVNTVCLNKALPPEVAAKINFLKIDTEGFESEILEGAEILLKSQQLFGIKSEVWFGPIKKPELFADIDVLLRANGFHLFDITVSRYPRKTFDRGYIKFDKAGRPASLDSRLYGQVLTGDVLYLKDPVFEYKNGGGTFVWNDENVLAMSCIFYAYNLFDCAVELLETYKAVNQKTVLPLDAMIGKLCPKLPDGTLISYKDYIQGSQQLPWEELELYKQHWTK
jgi:FkbM family methyltransferase